MNIVFHAHHADVSNYMRGRAEAALRRLARRSGRPVDAVIRFEQDGAVRRVELTLHAAGRRYAAHSEGRFFGRVLSDAVRHLSVQLDHNKRPLRARAQRRRMLTTR